MQKKILHLNKIIFQQAEKFGQRAFIYHKNDDTNVWEPVSWNTFATEVRLIGKALISLGVKEGDRVGIFSQNMYQHLVVDFANFAIKAVSVPIYATSSPSQLNAIISNASIDVLFVGETEQLETLHAIKPVKKVVVFDDEADISEFNDAQTYTSLLKKSFDKAVDTEFENRLAKESEDDLMNILYTSGTTGQPKGVEIRQSNYTEFIRIHNERFSLIDKSDISLSFLPLSHVFERAWTYFCIYKGVTIYLCHFPSDVEECMKEVRPTAMCAVPRYWEKVYAAVQSKVDESNFISRQFYYWALAVGKKYNLNYKRHNKHANTSVSAYYKMFSRPLFNKIKREIGLDRGRFFACAGAKLSDEINEYMHSIGLNLCYGYGLTESTASVSCFLSENIHYVIGSAGRIMPDVKVRISQDGEILLKGKTLTKGYFNNPDATKRAFTEDGWFRTGDSGFIDMHNNLYVTDRIKDMFKTAGGKFIAPQQLENLMIEDNFVEQAVAIGNERKYVSMLIVPKFSELEQWAKEHNLKWKDNEELIALPEVYRLFKSIVDKRTGHLARYERIKRFSLLPSCFTMEQGHLTNTLKIKRKVINEMFKTVIDAMYN
ncbi:MAG: long-chain fatty acid--CoA ligase [Paludibacteraceae bacterium]|nr:long-chain fatty acid--CoA ligase [Paludibacteraceae bacterium]